MKKSRKSWILGPETAGFMCLRCLDLGVLGLENGEYVT